MIKSVLIDLLIENQDLQVETVDIASDSSSAKAQGKTTLTHNLNSSLATGIQVESNKSQELQKNDKMVRILKLAQ